MGGSHELPPEPHDEQLRSYGDLLAWSVRTGALEEPVAARLARLAGSDSGRAETVLADAIAQREGAYAVLRPLAEGRRPSADALREVEKQARRALALARLEPSDDGAYRWRWEEREDLRLPLWPLAHAAAELLGEGPLDRLKRCEGCRWLFLDQSKNRSRHWCSMEGLRDEREEVALRGPTAAQPRVDHRLGRLALGAAAGFTAT